MKIELDVPEYSAKNGVLLCWDDGFEIAVDVEDSTVILRANAAGLRSLARHLLELSGANVPDGTRVHLDASNSLEDGSPDVIIERMARPGIITLP